MFELVYEKPANNSLVVYTAEKRETLEWIQKKLNANRGALLKGLVFRTLRELPYGS